MSKKVILFLSVSFAVLIIVTVVIVFAFNNKSRIITSDTRQNIKQEQVNDSASSNISMKQIQSYDLNLKLSYPAIWSIGSLDQPSCSGEFYSVFKPSRDEIDTSSTGTLEQYDLTIIRYGKNNTQCAPDGVNYQGSKAGYIVSSDQLTSGLFKGSWITFSGSQQSSDGKATPDRGVITRTQYTSSDSVYSDAGTLAGNSNTYQITINTNTQADSSGSSAQFDPDTFKTTQLYKDTLNILNSIEAY